MKFYVEGIRTTVTTVTIVEKIAGEIDITKKEVLRTTDCPSVLDGDSTAWYDYVSDALSEGAKHKACNGIQKETVEKKTKIDTEAIVDEVQW